VNQWGILPFDMPSIDGRLERCRMRAAVLKGRQGFAIEDVPDPVPAPDEVVVRVKYCGVCGSDLHIYKEGAEIGAGHEYSGDIVAVGRDVTQWRIGDRVAVEPRIACGECHYCRRGEVNLCDQYYAALLQYEGAFATYAKTRQSQLHRLPDSMGYEQAALVEPVTCALHAVGLSGMRQGDVVAVLGLGSIGHLVACVVRLSGAGAVYGAEMSPSRIALARGITDDIVDVGASASAVDQLMELTGGNGPDIVFECSGSVQATQDAVAVARKGGTIVIAGICFDWVSLPVSNIVLRELTVKGSICFSSGEYATAFGLVSEGRIDAGSLVTEKVPLDGINSAFEMALRGEGLKILVCP
jgi:2-desacetyl-2-hydroxyethyl bacteriochlorophyllide A dehydrogenase